MRAVRGRQLVEEGVILDETCAWDDFEEDVEDTVVDDKDSVISAQSLCVLHDNFPSIFNDAINSANPAPESVVSLGFSGVFDSGDVVPLTDDGGVLKKLLVAGNGPLVNDMSIVHYHYSAYVGDQVFATSHLQRLPVRYRIGLGIGPTLPCAGLDVALRSMKSGEIALFFTSPEYGYGRVGLCKVGGKIPKNAPLMWKVQVFEVTPASACDDLLMLASDEERHNVPFEKLHSAATEEKDKGTYFYHKDDFFSAKRCYARALRLMQGSIPHDESDEQKMVALTGKLLRNLAQTCLKLRKNVDCCRFADEALELDKNDFTALRKKLSALINLGQFDSAKKCLVRCEKLCPAESKSKLDEDRRRLIEESQLSKENSRKLEGAMAKGLFSPARVDDSSSKKDNKVAPVIDDTLSNKESDRSQVSELFQTTITTELDELIASKKSTPESLNYELADLSKEEVAFIEREASKRGFSSTKIEAEIGRVVLIVQTKPK